MDSLLNTGEVPNLFSVEEKVELIEVSTRPSNPCVEGESVREGRVEEAKFRVRRGGKNSFHVEPNIHLMRLVDDISSSLTLAFNRVPGWKLASFVLFFSLPSPRWNLKIES